MNWNVRLLANACLVIYSVILIYIHLCTSLDVMTDTCALQNLNRLWVFSWLLILMAPTRSNFSSIGCKEFKTFFQRGPFAVCNDTIILINQSVDNKSNVRSYAVQGNRTGIMKQNNLSKACTAKNTFSVNI